MQVRRIDIRLKNGQTVIIYRETEVVEGFNNTIFVSEDGRCNVSGSIKVIAERVSLDGVATCRQHPDDQNDPAVLAEKLKTPSPQRRMSSVFAMDDYRF
ncbi:MAG TPA: hypothetical protein VJI33_05285 [Candidatus Paceibacterota bacterium]